MFAKPSGSSSSCFFRGKFFLLLLPASPLTCAPMILRFFSGFLLPPTSYRLHPHLRTAHREVDMDVTKRFNLCRFHLHVC
jgi:hypothetical protein